MKKVLISLSMIAFCIATTAQASELMGGYVAPRFVLGIQQTSPVVDATGLGLGDYREKLNSVTKVLAGGALALGWDFGVSHGYNVRTELEYTYTSNWKKSGGYTYNGARVLNLGGSIGAQSVTVNVYYDFRNETRFTPYVGGGLGLGFVSAKMTAGLDPSLGFGEIHGTMKKKTTTNLAWNIGLGCSYAATDRVAIDLGYRYAGYGKAKTGNLSGYGGSVPIHASSNQIGMHQIILGARIKF